MAIYKCGKFFFLINSHTAGDAATLPHIKEVGGGGVGGPSMNGELGSSGKQRALIYVVSLEQVKSFLCATVLPSREHACQAEVTSDKNPVLTDL